MTELVCRQIGETARRLLTPGMRGRVLAACSQAAYLVTEQEELVWLASASAPRHPRALRIAGPLPTLVAGDAFSVDDECANIAPDFRVDLGQAPIWAAPPIPGNAAVPIDQMPARVRGAFAAGSDPLRARGFGRLIPKILALAAGQPDDQAEGDPVLALAWPHICQIARACLRHDPSALLSEASALIGLGAGLTPDGDDFLGGLLFCINTMQRLYPGLIHLGRSEQALLIESARQRTNGISFTLLRDLSHGHAVEPLHELIRAVLCDVPPEGMRQAAMRLSRIGHSTGWDLLTGALTGLLVTFRRHRKGIIWTSSRRSQKPTRKPSAA